MWVALKNQLDQIVVSMLMIGDHPHSVPSNRQLRSLIQASGAAGLVTPAAVLQGASHPRVSRQVELSKQHLPLSLPCRDVCGARCWSLFAGSILICPHMPGQAPPPVKESLRLNSICIVNYPFHLANASRILTQRHLLKTTRAQDGGSAAVARHWTAPSTLTAGYPQPRGRLN